MGFRIQDVQPPGIGQYGEIPVTRDKGQGLQFADGIRIAECFCLVVLDVIEI